MVVPLLDSGWGGLGGERCLGSEAAGRRLEEDMRLGDALGVTVTPTFFYRFGGQFGAHIGLANEEQLLELIEGSR